MYYLTKHLGGNKMKTEKQLIQEYNTHMRVYDKSHNIFDLQYAENCVFELMEIKGFTEFKQAYDYIDSLIGGVQ